VISTNKNAERHRVVPHFYWYFRGSQVCGPQDCGPQLCEPIFGYFTTCFHPTQKTTLLPQQGQRFTTNSRVLAGAGSVIVPSGRVNSLISV